MKEDKQLRNSKGKFLHKKGSKKNVIRVNKDEKEMLEKVRKIPPEEMKKLMDFIEKRNKEISDNTETLSSWEEFQNKTDMSDEHLEAVKRSTKRLGVNLFSKKD